MVTLAELAAQQVADPNNLAVQSTDPNAPGYINPASPYAKPTPQQQTAFNAGINTPPTQGGAVLGKSTEPYVPPMPTITEEQNTAYDERGRPYFKDPQLEVQRKAATAALPPDLSGTTAPPGAQIGPPTAPKEAFKVPGATPVGGGGGKPTGPSLEQDYKDKSEENMSEMEKSVAAERAANEKSMKALQAGLDAGKKAQVIADATRDLNSTQSKLEHYQAEQADAERSRKHQQEVDDARAMKVDPNHFYKERGTAGSILAALSMAAGAFAAALPTSGNKENFAMKIINNAIDRDIDAQKENIDNKWKAVNYQGNKDQRDYIKSQFTLSQKDDAREKEYLYAKGMVADIRQNATDQAAIHSLGKLDAQLDQKLLGLKQSRMDHMLTVMQQDRARKAAAAARAANANPLSAANLNKDYAEYTKNAAAEQVKNPKAGPIMSREEWFKVRQGKGARGAAGGGDTSAVESDKDFKEMLKDPVLDKMGVVSQTFGDNWPRLAPNSAQITVQLKGLNLKGKEIAGKVLKETEGRISPVLIEELKNFEINGGTKELAQAKIKALQETVKAAYRQAGVTGPSVSRSPEGATER